MTTPRETHEELSALARAFRDELLAHTRRDHRTVAVTVAVVTLGMVTWIGAAHQTWTALIAGGGLLVLGSVTAFCWWRW